MPRGQKVGWRERRKAVVEKPEKPVKKETGIWLYPSGKFGAFLYQGSTSVFLGTRDTLEAARELRAAAKLGLKSGQAPATRMDVRVPLQKFFDEVFEPEAMAGLKDSTRRSAKSRFNAQIRAQLGEVAVGEITYERCAKFRAALVAKEKLSGQTKRETLMLLRQVLSEAVRRGLLQTNPALLLKLPEKAGRQIQIPDLEVIHKVIEGIRDPVSRMLAELLLRSGLRLNEATALQWGDIDTAEGRIHVRRSIDAATRKLTTPKTAESFRVVDVPRSLIEMLERYKESLGKKRKGGAVEGEEEKEREPWVFPSDGDGPIDGRNFSQRDWAPAVTAAAAPRVTPHGLRHLFASHLLQRGVEILYVANQLGHTSAGFTLKQYGHLLRKTSPSRAKLERAFPK